MNDSFDDNIKASITAVAAQSVDHALAKAKELGHDPIASLDGLIMTARECIAVAEEAKEQIQKERQK
ncbi:hypothetical protein [Roseovarius indicus]|uniref:Uncharacterized protein n=1 Tax=Roseovarius indicus TaxID=540747 RepID=A0A0T5PB45_9RHOB|nr:hypothetical protein [Roseovarius indicus]KRS18232.1 hypothetical protein XM52_08775 [Roseovarius indicus]QEW26935.1 hypothetical protein RIdsm_02743 [Roseovarius indicus]SFD57496.1 hypothetical protein SAMN04488031_101601 [Roseovarius indicus]